jgi:murein DD-endopeptidase MepM/ murein hydrolase activator NlpD
MTDSAVVFVKRNVLRFAVTGLVGIWLAGCAADTSRFGEPISNPFGNPFASSSGDAGAPTPRVASTPSASGSANPNYLAAAHPNPVASSALPAASPSSTGQIRQPVEPVRGSAVGWSPVGGSPIIVAEGDSIAVLSSRYGVPEAALMNANGLSSASQIHGGMRLVVPVYNARGKIADAAPENRPRESRSETAEVAPARQSAARRSEREVADASDDSPKIKANKKHEREIAEDSEVKAKKKLERETADASDDSPKVKAKKKLEREAADASDDSSRVKGKKKLERESADASDDAAKVKGKKKLERETADASDDTSKLKAKKKLERETAQTDDAVQSKSKKAHETIAENTAVPATKIEKSKPAATPAPVTVVAKADPPSKATSKKGAVDPAPTGNVHGAGTAPTSPLTGEQDATATSPEFRWPARGRIIQAFKSGGNDGINISVPEGTSVRAAENGTVAYAGSELKGYGNLVLIRHPNGFVSAYANNGELDVKRGDVVKRGQVIAKSGQSGNVSSPQLHFELRKGSTPVDPTSYLAGL